MFTTLAYGVTVAVKEGAMNALYRTVAILGGGMAFGAGVAMAEVRVDDLPKPIPQVMEKVKEVGNEVGKGLSKAASTTADAVNKAVKSDKSNNQKLQKPTK
jgi:hypothetical protein